jgi:hypothetical protein
MGLTIGCEPGKKHSMGIKWAMGGDEDVSLRLEEEMRL